MIRASVICIAALSLFHSLPAANSALARDADAARARVLVAAKGADVPASEVQKVQRLLKFLSQRNPARFGKVDPGPVDGKYGAEVKAAIIKFQRIVGVPINPVVDRELLSQIISALAETPDASETALAGCAENPANPACKDEPSKTAPAPIGVEGKPPKPRLVTRMFVQLASLPSLPRAKREWRRLKRTNEYVLGNAEVQFRQVEIKGRGTYFRVFVGPYENMADARNVCVGLGREGRNCIVVRRKVAATTAPTEAAAAPEKTKAAGDPESPATPEKPSGPTAAADAAPDKSAPKPESAAAPTNPDAPGKPVAATAAPLNPTPEIRKPDEPAEGPGEIFSLTLQTPVLTPGAQPPPGAPKANAEPSTVAARDTGSIPTNDKGNAAAETTQATAPQQPEATEPKPKTAAEPSPTPTVKTEESAALAAVRPGGGSKPPTPVTGSAQKATAADKEPAAAAKPNEKPTTEAKPNAEKANKKKKEKSKATVGPLGVLFERLPRVTWPRLLLLTAIVAGGVGLYYVWRRRRIGRSRRRMPAGLPKTITEAWTSALEENSFDKPETFDELRSDFESPQMQQSRTVRDAFLRDVLEDNDIEAVNGVNKEAALSVNRGLKLLLETDPARYKQIFLNWLFMDRMGAALDRHEVSADQLDDSINREFALLRSYFRIHLLELDDRHRLRSSLPGLFHCLVYPRP